MKKIFALLAGMLVMGSTAVLADEGEKDMMPPSQQEGAQQQSDASQDVSSKPAKKHHKHHARHHNHHHKHKHKAHSST